MDYLESNECSNDKCECKEPFQSQVYYPKNLAEVDGVDLCEMGWAWPCKANGGGWVTALPCAGPWDMHRAGRPFTAAPLLPPQTCVFHFCGTTHALKQRNHWKTTVCPSGCNVPSWWTWNKIATSGGCAYAGFLGGEGEERFAIFSVTWLVPLMKEFLSYGPGLVSA